MTGLQCYLRLLRWITPDWKICLLAIFAMVVMALSLSTFPFLVQQITASVFIQKSSALTLTAFLSIITLFLVYGVANIFNIYSVNKLNSKLGSDLRKAMFDKLLSLPTYHHNTSHKNKIADKFTKDISQATFAATRLITILIFDSITIIGLIICMQLLNWELSFLMFLIMPLLLLLLLTVQGFLEKPDQKNIQATKTLTNHVLQSIEYHKIIKLNSAQSQESQNFKKHTEDLQHTETQQTTLKIFVLLLGQIIFTLILTALVALIIQQALSQTLTLDQSGALIAAILLLIIPIKHIAEIPKYMQHGEQAIRNIFSLLDLQSEENSNTNANTTHKIKGRLVFDHVCFYNNTTKKNILNNISFSIKQGEIVALVCANPHEKTALIDLILGFSQPTSGKILLDNQTLTDIKPTNLYAHIAVISEHAVLLEDTIAGNIAYGMNQCTSEAKITAAAQTAHATKFIQEMPEGLQTPIGENGMRITEPQRQHIAIAHTLLQNPCLLILDEIPNPIYLQHNDLLYALNTLAQGRTTLIITEKNSEWKKIDRVLALHSL
ncbi:MAG: ABC transporter ATP-binding protein/permease [Betaproteobacteria bacterium]|nr:ABC transporter ATP-binding protein/permease [Betaproteobacteria bacterium]